MATNNCYSGNGSSATPINGYYLESCGLRLPCGICRLTMSQCPKMPMPCQPSITTMTYTGAGGGSDSGITAKAASDIKSFGL